MITTGELPKEMEPLLVTTPCSFVIGQIPESLVQSMEA
jgi:hypothetical protein